MISYVRISETHEQFPTTVVECLLYAIKQGSVEACQRFPRLLQIVEYYPKTLPIFMRQVRSFKLIIMWESQEGTDQHNYFVAIMCPILIGFNYLYPKLLHPPPQVNEIPCWMFVSWVAQMTAMLDKRESPAVQELLVKLAQLYPQVE